ncbi:hypothetical protein [Reichenbachiella ulvae]|uniref:Uncharacterized protein n=1 Tax=Reichenbachiella ulvae TaxID=2980104 RepID=A0ABT3CS09_9BACT|nr:hypothetical protein [Reichenbachiella ulvae]MCV9386429.1 hypothetical protein [Reichenbachiella ulvae]
MNQEVSHVLVFKTNIQTHQRAKSLRPLLNNHPTILDWSVDTEDVDKVLRVVAKQSLKEREVISLVVNQGFFCEELE